MIDKNKLPFAKFTLKGNQTEVYLNLKLIGAFYDCKSHLRVNVTGIWYEIEVTLDVFLELLNIVSHNK